MAMTAAGQPSIEDVVMGQMPWIPKVTLHNRFWPSPTGTTSEGEDKPLKYPSIFNSVDISVVTRMVLAKAAEFDRDAACDNIRAVRPGMPVFQVSARSGDGMEKFLDFLATRFVELRQAAVSRTPAA